MLPVQSGRVDDVVVLKDRLLELALGREDVLKQTERFRFTPGTQEPGILAVPSLWSLLEVSIETNNVI